MYTPNRDYPITYNLGGGSASNPATYDLASNITLGNPYKFGFKFNGWKETGNDEPHSVSIPQGSFGNKNYTADYEDKTVQLSVYINYQQEIPMTCIRVYDGNNYVTYTPTTDTYGWYKLIGPDGKECSEYYLTCVKGSRIEFIHPSDWMWEKTVNHGMSPINYNMQQSSTAYFTVPNDASDKAGLTIYCYAFSGSPKEHCFNADSASGWMQSLITNGQIYVK